ncbi:Na+/H+ antiporter [Planomonospora algeriensis]
MVEAVEALRTLALPVGAVAVAAAARRFNLSPPIMLVVAGLVVSFVPGLPAYEIDPGFVLAVFLPPLLYAAALESSYLRLKDNALPIVLLSIGLVLFTTAVVGVVAHALVPGLSLAAGLVLGAIVAPPDAVAAVGIARRLRLPRRVLTILVGESLFNDATALTLFGLAVTAALPGAEPTSLLSGIVKFAVVSAGGIALGLVLGPVLRRLHRRLNDPLVVSALSLLVPFTAYLLAEAVHVSGVLAVVVTGLYLGYRSPEESFTTRVQGTALWAIVGFALESVVFALIGLQLRPILQSLSGGPELIGYAAVVFLVVVATRLLWVPATHLPAWLSRRRGETDTPWQGITIVSWAGMRGVVSLAAAFGVSESLQSRNMILFLTFSVVLGTLLVQGVTFPLLIRRLKIGTRDEEERDVLDHAMAQQEAGQAALRHLESLVAAAGPGAPPADLVERLRRSAEERQHRAWEGLRNGAGPDGGAETPSTAFRRLRTEMMNVERGVFARLRDERRIDDEVFRKAMHALDHEEAMLTPPPPP